MMRFLLVFPRLPESCQASPSSRKFDGNENIYKKGVGVGALTLKEFAFKGRPWEIFETNYYGLSDTLGLGLRLCIKKASNIIFRVIPLFSDSTGTKLICDFSRHCVIGMTVDRIEVCHFYLSRLLVRNFQDCLGISSTLFSGYFASNLSYYQLLFNSLMWVAGPYTSLTSLFFLAFQNSEKGLNFCYNSSFLRKENSSLYPFLYGSSSLAWEFVDLNKESRAGIFSNARRLSNDFRSCVFSFGVDFTSEFAPLINKLLRSFKDQGKLRGSFVLGLLSFKIQNVFYTVKKGLSFLVLSDFLEGRFSSCKNACKTVNSFSLLSTLLKRRFDGTFLHCLANKIPFINNSSGVLSSIPSEVSSNDFFTEKNVFLRGFSLLNNVYIFYYLKKSFLAVSYFTFCLGRWGFNFLNSIKKKIFISFGEIREKISFISSQSLTFLRVYLSGFHSRNTKFVRGFFSINIFGGLLLPKTFLVEETFDFISTLGCYKWGSQFIFESCRLWLLAKISKYNLIHLLLLSSGLLSGFSFFVLRLKGFFFRGTLKSFPVYISSGLLFLTELKSLSKENFFQEDPFLQKSSILVGLVRFFRESHSRFKC